MFARDREELNNLAAARPGAFETWALFVADENVAQTSHLWKTVQSMPAASVVADPHGEFTRRFDLRTSGELRLFNPSGQPCFHGGITQTRGHVGDNPGSAAILAALDGRATAATASRTPVFGCALFELCGPEHERR